MVLRIVVKVVMRNFSRAAVIAREVRCSQGLSLKERTKWECLTWVLCSRGSAVATPGWDNIIP